MQSRVDAIPSEPLYTNFLTRQFLKRINVNSWLIINIIYLRPFVVVYPVVENALLLLQYCLLLLQALSDSRLLGVDDSLTLILQSKISLFSQTNRLYLPFQ